MVSTIMADGSSSATSSIFIPPLLDVTITEFYLDLSIIKAK